MSQSTINVMQQQAQAGAQAQAGGHRATGARGSLLTAPATDIDG